MITRHPRTGFSLVLIILLSASTGIRAQDTTDLPFDVQLSAAYEEGNESVLRSLIRQNRLLVKPVVLDLVSESIRIDLRGESEEACRTRKMAETIAGLFEEIFGERCLTLAVSYVSNWSLEQKAKKLKADSLYTLGTELRNIPDSRNKALTAYEETLKIYRELGDRFGEGSTLGGLGVVYWYMGDADSVLIYYENALAVRKSVDDRQLIGNSLNSLGSVYRSFFNDLEKALDYFLEAEIVRAEIGDTVGLGATLTYIAVTYREMGKHEDALINYDRSIVVNSDVGDDTRVAVALRNVGAILIDLGRYSEALEYLLRALDINDERGERLEAGGIINWIGVAYRNLGDYKSAQEYYEEAIQVAQDTDDDTGLVDANHNLGVLLLYSDRPQRAAEYFARALEQYKDLGNTAGSLTATFNLGSSLTELGDYQNAETYLSTALNDSRILKDKMGEGTSLVLLGNVQHFAGKLDESLVNYRAALELARTLSAPHLLFISLMGLGDNSEKRGDVETALDYYDQAFVVLENTRGTLYTEEDKAGFLARQRYAYEAVIHLLSKRHEDTPGVGYDGQAFHIAERAKARAFLDLLAEALANVRSGVDPDLLQQQRLLLNNLTGVRENIRLEASEDAPDEVTLANLRRSLNDLESDYEELERAFRTQNPKYSELQYPQPGTLREVQDLLEDDTILLEYAVGDSSSSLWAVTNESAELYRLPAQQLFQDQVDLLQFALSDPNQANTELFTRVSRRLYELLVGPAEGKIPQGKKLIVIPDGVLHYVPFEVLLTENTSETEGSFDTLPYLIRRHAISYAPSASVLLQLRRDDRREKPDVAGKQLLAFGDPVFDAGESYPEVRPHIAMGGDVVRAGLARLPYSGTEVRSIAQFFPAGQTDVFLRADATEEHVKGIGSLDSYRYIHFATHGLINERRPDFSSIVLTRDSDREEDGILQAAEIFNLELGADLVVLSACRTGLGKMVRGEGMMGLTRAFMYAGASSLVVSLWSVADRSTSSLMEHFYENLIVQKRDKAEALRRAKTAMIDQEAFAHPFYWAPFILTGDWQ